MSVNISPRAPKTLSDVNDTAPYAFTIVVREETPKDTVPFHRHRTGQFVVPVACSRCGVAFKDRRWVLPRFSAAWIPPDVSHVRILDAASELVMLHVAPEVAATLPSHPVRLLINEMTLGMIRHFSRVYGTTEVSLHARRIASLVVEELRHAPELPEHFAPMPHHPTLTRIAEELLEPDCRRLTNDDWAKRACMTTKSLSRLVARETGMSFAKWRLHLLLLSTLNHLESGNTVEEVAWETGFETASAYIEAFRKVFGTTPGRFRKTVRAEPDAENLWAFDYE